MAKRILLFILLLRGVFCLAQAPAERVFVVQQKALQIKLLPDIDTLAEGVMNKFVAIMPAGYRLNYVNISNATYQRVGDTIWIAGAIGATTPLTNIRAGNNLQVLPFRSTTNYSSYNVSVNSTAAKPGSNKVISFTKTFSCRMDRPIASGRHT